MNNVCKYIFLIGWYTSLFSVRDTTTLKPKKYRAGGGRGGGVDAVNSGIVQKNICHTITNFKMYIPIL